MPAGRNPTVRQAKTITAARLNYKNWLVIKDLPLEMHIKNRITDKVRIIKKRQKET
ncbi:MAG: hypothetical protein FWD01_03195 [Defluviitaleaceae bacterium]|nr:hypothetical protein [Defluviitaleaceae bacterium]